MRFEDKVVLITGGARGLGFAIAESFAAQGAAIVIADIDLAAADAAARRLGDMSARSTSVHCDVADERSMEAAVTHALDAFGRLDILIANAGLHLSGYVKTPCELATGDWRRLLDVNVLGVVHGARACRGAMARAGGVIVTIASMASYKGENAYGISKLAVRGLTVALAKELAQDGIRVCGVAPGLIGTEEVMENFPADRRRRYVEEVQLVPRLGEPADISSAVLFLASDDAAFISGETIVVSGGALCRI